MSARAFVVGTYLLALGLLIAIAPRDAAAADRLAAETLNVWTILVPLLVLATLAHSFPVHTPNLQSYYVSLPFFTVAILVLQPVQVAAVLAVPNLVEWRYRSRSWIAQLFNVSAYLISGLAAQAAYTALHPAPFTMATLGDRQSALAAGFAVLLFITLNRALVSGAIALANRLPPFGMAELESIAGEAILLGMGLPLAALAEAAPWALVPAAAPLLLVHRAFEMPHMRAQRRHDELTQLLTKSNMLEAAQRELSRAHRFARPVTLLAAEVVDFDALNTEHGRQAGDVVLRHVADVMRRTTREYDIAARMGDARFALVLPECDLQEAERIARRLQATIAWEPIEIPSRLEPVHIKLAIGLAVEAETSEALVHSAEEALARAAETADNLATAETDTTPPSPAAVTAPEVSAAADPPPPTVTELTPMVTSQTNSGRRWSIALQLSVLALALLIAVPLAPSFALLDPWTTAWMVGFVALAETLGIELFGGSWYSISTVPIIGAGLLLGPVGAVTVAPVGLVLRAIHMRTRWYKVVFNVNTHIIAGVAATEVFRALAPELSLDHLGWMIAAAALAGATFYLHTLLVAMAMATDFKVNPLRIWTEHFRWLWLQYVVLGALGLLLALAYHLFGLVGALIFIVPAVMMRYVAKQYLDKTMDHVRQLRALNEHLAREVTQRKRSEANLEHQALHDVLTDLPNRVLLQDRAQQSLLVAQRGAHSMALLLLDLDRFKEVNDTLGHHTGDILLKETAARLRHALRESDTIARLGGDEFAVLLPTADAAGAVETAQRLVAALEPSFDLEGRRVDIRASIGIALADATDDTPDALMRRADVAMYAAKRSGSGYRLYDADQDENRPERLALIADLRQAVANGELEVHYQPKLDLRTGRIASVEALARWQHPVRGHVAPAVFIPLAESIGLIEQLTRWVLEAALKQCREWRDAGIELAVAVNVSMRDLHDPGLPDTIAGLLGMHGLVPDMLTVEITESTLMADPTRALAITGALSGMGVRLAIDDFGTGYSSLAYLRQLPIDELKIDRTFVGHLATNPDDGAIVRSTISLAHDLGLPVVAEGVEDRRAYELLAAYGCDVAQGYFISRPMPSADIVAFVRGHSQSGGGFPLAA